MDERLPERWAETTLEDVLPIQYGKGLTETIRDRNGNVPVYGSSGIVGYHNQALTSNETLVLGRKGSVGSVYYSPVPCWPIDTTYFVEKTRSINLKFFLHLLSSLQLVKLDKSTAIPGLSRNDYNSITVKIPPVCEQARIVAAIEQQFTRLDSAVASLRSAQAKVKQYRASLLKATVEGELTKEWRAAHPASETGEQLLVRILAERRARWEEEQLAKTREKGIVPKDEKWKAAYKEPQRPDVMNLPGLPEGWCWATVEQLCERIVDCLHSTPKFQEEGFLCVDTNCIKPGKILLEKARYVDENTFIERNRRMKPREDDVIFSREGALLGVAVRVPEGLDFCLGQRMMVFRLNQFNAKYYELVLNSAVFRSQYHSQITGTAAPHLNIEDIRGFAIPLPPLTEQAQIVAEVEARLSNLAQLEQTIEHSLKRAEYERQSILREAFAGRLVEQDPTDEPASDLLERIREERAKREDAEKAARRANGGRGKQSNGQRQRLPAGEPSDALRRELQEARVVQMSWDMQV